MTIPKYEDLMLPILRLVASAGKETNVPEMLPALAREFSLSQDELEQRLASGRQTILANRCHWAQTYLRRAALLESVRRGQFKITDRGRNLLAEKLTRIDRTTLARYPEFVDWFRASREGEPDGPVTVPVPGSSEVQYTPDEQILAAYKLLNASLESEVLARVRKVTPTEFEQIVVDLLVAMDFGGGDAEMGKRLGRTGDGGIDGVIHEDALGLDAVYIQAKRYKDGNSVGRPDLQKFVGSLVGNRASKGVFVTASTFSGDAKEYVRTIQHRVVLIDGDEFARLLVRHDVGVRVDREVIIKKLDEDYFED